MTILWELYDDGVRTATARLGDPDLARDVVVKLLEKMDESPKQIEPENARFAFFAALKYRIIDAMRTRSLTPVHYAFDEGRDARQHSETPEQILTVKQEKARIGQLIGARADAALSLLAEGYEYSEIAEVLDVTPAAVRQIVSRARAQITKEVL